MKKVLFLFAFAGMCICGILDAQAQNKDISGVYTGTLSNVTMNGTHYKDVPDVEFTFTKNTQGGYDLKSAPIGPIGKMPGAINVDAKVMADANGNFYATPGSSAGNLELKGGIKIGISMNSFTGNANAMPLRFELNTYALKIFGFETFSASVTFTGNH